MSPQERTLLVLSIVVFFVMLGISIIIPVLPSYGKSFSISAFLVGVLVGSLPAARVVTDFPAGFLGDKFGNKKMMLLGLSLIALSSLLAGIALSYPMLLAVRVTEGIGSAFYVTSSLACLAKSAPMEARGKQMGYYVTALLTGQIIGPVIGGHLAVNFGLRSPFFFYALVASLGIIFVYFFLEIPKEERFVTAEDRRVALQLFKNRSFVIVNIGTMSAFFARGGLIGTVLPLFIVSNLHLKEDVTGLLISVTALASMATMVPAGSFADKHGRKIPFVASLVLMGLLSPLICLASDLWTEVIVMAGYGLVLGLHGPLASWSADLAPPKAIGMAMGVYRTIGDMGFFIGPIILSGVIDLTNSETISLWPFLVASIWLVASGLLLLGAEDPVGKKAVSARSMIGRPKWGQ